MTIKSWVLGVLVLAAGFVVLTVCSSAPFHEFLWETFTELGR